VPDPVLIVGGGLAGLACAGALEAKGVPYRLFEASDRVGGRVRTDVVEGFRLDRGFQVHFPAYPHARQALGDADLDLRPWRNGAIVWDGRRLRTLDRDRPFLTVWDGLLGARDLARLGLLATQALAQPVEVLRALSDTTTQAELERRGFSERAITRFLRPFFGGVFVDLPLGVSRRQFLFVMKMLAQSPACSPNLGMEAIPRALAARVPTSRVETQTAVDELLTTGGRVDGVRIGNERLPASSVVLATDADVAQSLSGLPLARGWLGSVGVWFESERAVCDDPYIVLNGTGRGRVNEVVPISNCAPGRAPEGRHLLCAVVVGVPQEPDDALVESVRAEIRAWFPDAGAMRFLRLDRIPRHQLAQPPGFDAPLPTAPPGLILAGEMATNCSIDGSIESGLRAAEAVAA